MKVTLRRASALQDEIRAARASLQLSPSAPVSIFHSDLLAELEKAREKNAQAETRSLALGAALFEIRRNVGRKNAEVGVSDRLADLAEVNDQIEFYSTAAMANPFEGEEILKGKAAKLLNRDDSQGSGFRSAPTDMVQVNLHSEEALEAYRQKLKELKRTRQSLQDELLGLNSATKIELSEQSVTTLKEEGLI